MKINFRNDSLNINFHQYLMSINFKKQRPFLFFILFFKFYFLE